MKYLYRFKQLIILAGDFIAFALALLISVSIRNTAMPDIEHIQKQLLGFFLVFLLWLVINYITGLYDMRSLHNNSNKRRIVEAASIAFIVAIIYFYINPDKQIAPKTLLILTTLIGYSLLAIWRLLYPRIIGDRMLQESIIFFGHADEQDELIHIIQSQKSLGFNISAVYHTTPSSNDSIFYTNSLNTLEQILHEQNITTIVVGSVRSDEHEQAREHFLYTCLFHHINIIDFASFYEQVTGRIPPSVFSKSWFLYHIQTADKPLYKKIRRVCDILAALLLGIILVILSPLVIPLIHYTSVGPIIFTQKRVGRSGHIFRMYKFRTMYSLSQDGSAETHGAQFAQKNDTRITPIGKLLRKTRIDELPQVWNIFKGEITLIGPRPERPEIVSQLNQHMPYYALRHSITPGITGWAQIHQHYTDTLETSLQKLQYDLFYIKNRSLLLDLSILLKTVNVVMRGLGQ